MTSCELKGFNNRTVSITFHDGEVATGRLTCSSDDCEDVIVDIVSTNRPERYAQLHACSSIVPASELVSVADIVDTSETCAAPPQTERLRGALHLVEQVLKPEDTPEPLAA